MKSVRLLSLAAGLFTLAGVTFVAADEAPTTIKFGDPGKPGTLKVALARGDVRIEEGDTSEISVKSETQPQRRPRKDGLRVLTEAASYSLTEKDNVVTLDALADGWTGAPSDFHVIVPPRTHVVVTNSLGGAIVCTKLTGDVEIKSLHGEVVLREIVGGALVETTNGEIKASIREVNEGKPLSFTSMNGAVVLQVPEKARASVRLRTHNGTILTDFDDKALVTKVEAASLNRRTGKGRGALGPEAREAFREAARAGAEATRRAAEAIREAAEAVREGAEIEAGVPGAPQPPVPPIPPLPAIPSVTGGKLVTGALNGGGPEINVATMNGDVTLRKLP